MTTKAIVRRKAAYRITPLRLSPHERAMLQDLMAHYGCRTMREIASKLIADKHREVCITNT